MKVCHDDVRATGQVDVAVAGGVGWADVGK